MPRVSIWLDRRAGGADASASHVALLALIASAAGISSGGGIQHEGIPCPQGCAWTKEYPCPGSPKHWRQAHAKDDGSACFNVRTGRRSNEMSWGLECNGRHVLSGGPYGTWYSHEDSVHTYSLDLPPLSTCTLSMQDLWGNGWDDATWSGLGQKDITLGWGHSGSHSFVVRTGRRSNEMSWGLECNGRHVLSGGPYGTWYSHEDSVHTYSLDLPPLSTCTLSMQDLWGNGWDDATWSGLGQKDITLGWGHSGSHSFVVRTGRRSNEMSWGLECNGRHVLSGGPYGTWYSHEDSVHTYSLDLPPLSTCTLSMQDLWGNGWDDATWSGLGQKDITLGLEEKVKGLLSDMVLSTEVSALLPWGGEDATLLEGQMKSAEALFSNFTQAPMLVNLTSALVLYFSKIDPSQLNSSWTEEMQRAWLGRLFLLGSRVKHRSEGAYLKELLEKAEEYITVGAGDALAGDYPSSFQRRKAELWDGLDDLQQSAPGVFLGYTVPQLCRKAGDFGKDAAEDVVSSTGVGLGAVMAYHIADAAMASEEGSGTDHGRRLRAVTRSQSTAYSTAQLSQMPPKELAQHVYDEIGKGGYRHKVCKGELCGALKATEVDHRVEKQTLKRQVEKLAERGIYPTEEDVKDLKYFTNSRPNLKEELAADNQDFGRWKKKILAGAEETVECGSNLLCARDKARVLFKELEGAADMLECKGKATSEICLKSGKYAEKVFAGAYKDAWEMLSEVCARPKSTLEHCLKFKQLKPLRHALQTAAEEGLGMATKKGAATVMGKGAKEGAQAAAKQGAEAARKQAMSAAAKRAAGAIARKGAVALATATTVGELLAPVIAATLTAQCLMPSDYSNEARLTGAAVGLGAGAVVGTAAYRALVARQAANLAARQAAVSAATAGQSAAARVLAKSVALGGKAIVSGARGRSAPTLAAGAAAGSAIIIVGVVAASAVTVADHFWVTDAEKEEELLRKDAFECDCAWTSDWVCPNSVLVRSPGEDPDKIARDDGSWCFSYCCGVVEESMTAAMKVIKNRDELAVHLWQQAFLGWASLPG
ncbi:hypothetical protein EMIHUDRAFT_221854 [Emiliania huxleyi CCMP1516]|uniref:Uncharacterized protein n=2 Tax=Emiliania huxleyi TaxID=2903 RepID=A0A0D3HXH7_EMIH1|nr:hypothetical protein EMIHUDRAFT_221854 [Emiliania huxleyi CCMP1516]EOD03712.1 hypothetical protein EMIHUDRAFT_221854 [Emiliania huxleyi CCMP1516]|eukprot:XP_005756141.1 hypothetical protein EMIHUDRAFT_221854 [Emiliania huxleyi CCMP1516]